MSRKSQAGGLLVTALFLAQIAAPQNSACGRRTVPILVESSDGRPVAELAATDLVAKLAGKEVKVLSIETDRRPHRIVILLDASGSMKMHWSRAVTLALGIVEDQLPDTEVALALFNDDIAKKVDFAEGRPEIVSRLHELKVSTEAARGSTALYAALLQGVHMIGSPTSADVLYVIGDGEDNASDIRFEKTMRQLEPTGIRVFVSLMLEDETRPKAAKAARRVMNELAKRTGGELVEPFAQGFPKSKTEIEQFAARMNAFHRRMIAGFLVELEPIKPPPKSSSLEVHLSVEASERLKAFRILYPAELAACPSDKSEK